MAVRTARMPGCHLIFALFLIASGGLARAQDAPPPTPRRIVIGTAALSGVYYQIGAALCRFVSVRAAVHGVTCRAEVSGGSRANIAGLMSGDVDLAIVQANIANNAAHGLGDFQEAGPQSGLRMVMRLYNENLTIVARPGAGIASLEDLRGKRVNLGPESSGTRRDAIRVLGVAGIAVADLAEAPALSPDEHNAALCAGRIEAYIYIVGHPNRNTRAAIERCGASLVPISAATRAVVVRDGNEVSDTPIPGGLYPRHDRPTPSLAVAAMLVASDQTPADVVTLVIRGVQDNLRDFRRLHPVLTAFSDAHAFDGPIAPLHPGTLDRRTAAAQP
jgi:TRAP transporter TAXI family solute receptor